MNAFYLISFLFLFISSNSYADEFYEKTRACRAEVKVLGPDLLDEDENCIWLEENKYQVYEKCKACRAELELIKEASRGNFDF